MGANKQKCGLCCSTWQRIDLVFFEASLILLSFCAACLLFEWGVRPFTARPSLVQTVHVRVAV